MNPVVEWIAVAVGIPLVLIAMFLLGGLLERRARRRAAAPRTDLVEPVAVEPAPEPRSVVEVFEQLGDVRSRDGRRVRVARHEVTVLSGVLRIDDESAGGVAPFALHDDANDIWFRLHPEGQRYYGMGGITHLFDVIEPELSWGDVAELTYEQRQALPAEYHVPVFESLSTNPAWLCKVCYDDGLVTTWPCAPATAGGVELAERLGIDCVR